MASPLRVALYARVSTSDKDQNPAMQLDVLRKFVEQQTWTVHHEYVDHASAADLRGRVQWRKLKDDAARRRFDVVLIWRLDRAFWSVLDGAATLEQLRAWGVGIRSFQEPYIDTTSPFGEALYYITIAYASLERGILKERVKQGMEYAKAHGTKSGKKIGRPSVMEQYGFDAAFGYVAEGVQSGTMSMRGAAREMKAKGFQISEKTIRTMLKGMEESAE